MITKPVAKAIIIDGDNNILAIRRCQSDSCRPGELDLPGGGVENGERFVEAAVREIKEEVGIKVDVSQLDLVFSATRVETQNQVKLIYITKPKTTDVRLSPEHSEYIWMSMDHAIREFEAEHYKFMFRYLLDNKIIEDLSL